MARMYNTAQKEGESLQAYYRRLAKTADQRLVRLEQLSKQENFAAVTGYSYKRALKDIHMWSGAEAMRFNTAPPDNQAQLLAKIADIKQFIEAPTSTKGQIVIIYKKRADTLNKKYGTKFTWQSLATYHDSGLADKMDAKYGSKTALKIIANIQAKDKAEIEAIKEAENRHKVADGDILDSYINDALKDNNLNIEDLF